MALSEFMRERLASAYFFAIPGLMYGIFTSRLPAIKSMVQANDSQIGFLLLAFGAASFAGLVGSGRAIALFGAKKVTGITGFVLPVVMCFAALALNYWQLVFFCMLGGLASGLCEVAMNAQGIMIERKHNRMCMSSLHACFSLGGMAGALSGSLCAALNLSPVLNFLCVSCVYLIVFPLAFRNMLESAPVARGRKDASKKTAMPVFIYLCGLMSLLCYVSEGSVGEWGSILLHSVKGAPQDQAALVFACFCATMVIFRFLGDRLRGLFGDVQLVFWGAMVGCISMTVVLVAKSPFICLGAYMVMGMGFAAIVPVIFSRAGRFPGISPERASSTVSIMSYTGLLVFPPMLGMAGDAIGLGNALWVIVAACLCVAVGSPFLLKDGRPVKTGREK